MVKQDSGTERVEFTEQPGFSPHSTETEHFEVRRDTAGDRIEIQHQSSHKRPTYYVVEEGDEVVSDGYLRMKVVEITDETVTGEIISSRDGQAESAIGTRRQFDRRDFERGLYSTLKGLTYAKRIQVCSDRPHSIEISQQHSWNDFDEDEPCDPWNPKPSISVMVNFRNGNSMESKLAFAEDYSTTVDIGALVEDTNTELHQDEILQQAVSKLQQNGYEVVGYE